MHSSTVYLTWALDGGGWSKPRPGRFTPEKDTVPIVYEQRPSEAWLPTYGLLTITEHVQGMHCEFPCRHGRDRLRGPFPPRLTRTVSHDFLGNFLPDLLQDVDL
jgi:hypothetical protein